MSRAILNTEAAIQKMKDDERLIAEVEIFVDLARQLAAQATMLRAIDEAKFGQMGNYINNLYADAGGALTAMRMEAIGAIGFESLKDNLQ